MYWNTPHSTISVPEAMASADLREELLCSICLTLYTDPVTLSCGHNFCRGCIDQVLSTQDGSGLYSCPECREEFKKRPTLKRNITLHNISERFLSTHPHQEEITGICCTYCVDFPVPAVRSCLLCEASLCDKHLKAHSKGPEHVLTDPSTSLGNRKCSVHKKILEYYCTEDAACICVSCSLAGEHRGHRVEMLDEASEKKKKKLRNVLQKLITKRKEIEERVWSLEERRRKAQEKASGKVERVNALFIDIRRRVDALEKKVLSEISRWEKEESLSLSDVIQKLEIKKDELSREMRHIEEMCNVTDPLTVLQDPDTSDLCDPEEEGGDEDTGGHDRGDEDTGGHDGGDEDTGGHDGGDEDTRRQGRGDEDSREHDVDVDVITERVVAGFSDIMTYLQTIAPAKPKKLRPQTHFVQNLPGHMKDLSLSGMKFGGDDVIVRTRSARKKVIVARNRRIYVQDPADILLDVNTAANDLLISDDLKTATWTEITQNRQAAAAERFDNLQVMSRRGFTSGRHYWDIEISEAVMWRVGMCYPSIDRRGNDTYIGDNNKSWCIFGKLGSVNRYLVKYDNKDILLPHQISSNRVRIHLDYEAGQLSFYELCDPIKHLHTYTASFSEPLHAVLYVYVGSIKILGGAAVRNHHHRRR